MAPSALRSPGNRQADRPDPLTELQGVIDRLFDGEGPMTVLEAGCGSSRHVELGDGARIVGIDISEEQLARNDCLDRKILGDVQTHDFAPECFDLIVCWDVLEHLAEPERALRSFARASKAGGVILLALPNVFSLKGLIAKFPSHWFHVWVYRSVFRNPNAGRPGHAPFPTFLRTSVSPRALERFAAETGLVEEHFRLYESTMIESLKRRSRPLHALYKIALLLLRVASLGAYDGSMTDAIIVLSKPPAGGIDEARRRPPS